MGDFGRIRPDAHFVLDTKNRVEENISRYQGTVNSSVSRAAKSIDQLSYAIALQRIDLPRSIRAVIPLHLQRTLL